MKFKNRGHIWLELYKANIYISPLDEMNAYAKQVTGKDDLTEPEPSVGARCCWLNHDNQRLIFIGIGKLLPGQIAHEAFHAVEFIFEKKGITHHDSSSEAFAYLLEYIVNRIYDVHHLRVPEGYSFQVYKQKKPRKKK